MSIQVATRQAQIALDSGHSYSTSRIGFTTHKSNNYVIYFRFHDRNDEKISGKLSYLMYRTNIIRACRGCDKYFNVKAKTNPHLDYCDRCSVNFTICETCGRTLRDERYCPRCFFQCDRCHEILPTDVRPCDYIDLCDDCAFTCSECDNVFYTEDALDEHWNEYHNPNRIHIQSYFYKPEPNFLKYRKENTNRFFGIELEMEFKNNDEDGLSCLKDGINDNLYYVKGDGSLNHGCELVTHPATKKYWVKRHFLKDEVKALADYGYRSFEESTTGLHIHVSKDSAPLAVWAKVALFWYAPSHDSFLKTICQRENSHYCQKKLIRSIDDTRRLTQSSTRYEAVNFENTYTVEFRQFKGTLNHESIIAGVLFLDWLIRYCEKHNGRDLVKVEAIDDFIAFVKNNEVDLYRYIKAHYQTTI